MSWAGPGRIFVRMLSGDAKRSSSGPDLGVVAAWSALAFVLALAWHGCSFAWADRASTACEPITFAVAGSPPAFVGAELELAMQEIHARTGLVFERESESGAARRPKLLVSWSVGETSRPVSALIVADRSTTGRLGYGAGRWREAEGDRELLEAAVEINGNRSWRRGLEASDALAAVFVHELGHVVGLSHNPDPASFMHHQAGGEARSWTEADAAQLAQLGRQAGCRPRGH